jgi:hypothetical protein
MMYWGALNRQIRSASNKVGLRSRTKLSRSMSAGRVAPRESFALDVDDPDHIGPFFYFL